MAMVTSWLGGALHIRIEPSLHQPPVTCLICMQDGHNDYLAASFVPSVGTTDIMVKVEALTNFTKQALLDSTKTIKAKYRHKTDSQQVP